MLWLAGPLHRLVPGCGVAGFAGPGRSVWRVQSRIAFLASPGRILPDQRTRRVRFMRRGSPWDL